jgi:hypothetical protein
VTRQPWTERTSRTSTVVPPSVTDPPDARHCRHTTRTLAASGRMPPYWASTIATIAWLSSPRRGPACRIRRRSSPRAATRSATAAVSPLLQEPIASISRTARSLTCGWTSAALGCHREIRGSAERSPPAEGGCVRAGGMGDPEAGATECGVVDTCDIPRDDDVALDRLHPAAPTASPTQISPRRRRLSCRRLSVTQTVSNRPVEMRLRCRGRWNVRRRGRPVVASAVRAALARSANNQASNPDRPTTRQ